MNRSPKHHLQAAPLHSMNVVGEMAPLHRSVIDHRKMHEAQIRQQEKIAQSINQPLSRLGML
jgi:hypothetical protein